jgi:REP element-mobilizing transposase RayT
MTDSTDKPGPSDFSQLWHSRGYLPHFDGKETSQVVTFRLHDSLPRHVVEEWKQQLEENADIDLELRKSIDRFEVAGHGKCYLRTPEVASMVESALLYFDGERYRLHAWVIMPNHVHIVFTPKNGFTPGRIMHSLKSYTSKEVNKMLDREGIFWMEDYFDRYIRDEPHFWNAVQYVERNPVKARLCKKEDEWRWSSARRRADQAKGEI